MIWDRTTLKLREKLQKERKLLAELQQYYDKVPCCLHQRQ